jgi:hypothetical protein
MDEPTVIINSGASVKTLGDYIEIEVREEMLRKQIDIQQCEITALQKQLMFYDTLEQECKALRIQVEALCNARN